MYTSDSSAHFRVQPPGLACTASWTILWVASQLGGGSSQKSAPGVIIFTYMIDDLQSPFLYYPSYAWGAQGGAMKSTILTYLFLAFAIFLVANL